MTRERRWLVLLVGIGAALPAAVLGPRLTPPAVEVPPDEPIVWRMPPPLSAALARPLFAAEERAASAPADSPDLVGVAGRLGTDAVAMVRGGDGSVRALKPGEAIDGWQLRSLSIDAAYFTRGGQQARVPLAGE